MLSRSASAPRSVRLLLGLGCALAAGGLRWILDPLIHPHMVFVFLMGGILLATLVGGTWAGMTAMVASAVLAEFLFVEPALELTLRSPRSLLLAALFASMSTAFVHGVNRWVEADADREALAGLRREVLDALPDAVCVLDACGTIIAVNRVWTEGPGNTGPDLFLRAGDNYLSLGARLPEAPDLSASLKELGRVVAGSLSELRFECRVPGRGRWFEVHARRFACGSERHTVVSHREITARKQAEAEVRANEAWLQGAVRDRERLLHELHHRVKNNLQLIASLLALQLRPLETPAARHALSEMRARIRAIAAVHERLCDWRGGADLDLADYLAAIVNDVCVAFGTSDLALELDLSLEPMTVSPDQAMRCGLIVNELVSNAIKHAFPGRRSGRLSLRAGKTRDGTAEIVVADDGVGLPAAGDAAVLQGVGMQLVAGLVQGLGGTLDIRTGRGTSCRVVFRPVAEVVESA